MSAKVEAQQQGADDDSQRLPEVRQPLAVCMDHVHEYLVLQDTQQKRGESEKEGETNRQQQATNIELTEVRSPWCMLGVCAKLTEIYSMQ